MNRVELAMLLGFFVVPNVHCSPPSPPPTPTPRPSPPVCGDGIVQTDIGEECDDDSPTCFRCKLSRCGDGVRVGADEPATETACPDGTCPGNLQCQQGLCVGWGEACDQGEANSDILADRCRIDCTQPRCGDGVVDAVEECDDGNDLESDGCSSTCESGLVGECQRSRDCEFDERCVDGICERRQVTCGDDNDCPEGQICRDESCVQDSRTPCRAHSDCTNGGEICIADALTQQGFCEGIRDQSCQEDRDCSFRASDNTARGLCEEGICKADQFFGCAVAQDCRSDFNCTPFNGRNMCLKPCRTNEVCDRTLECNANLQHCWYNLCGNSTELSSNFANTDNGRLGGACRADVPDAPAPTNCAQDSDCVNLGVNARCNDDLGTCEVVCNGDTSVCGTDATRDWYYCHQVSNTCEMMAGDGHCHEVSAGRDQWVGLCLAGGYLALGETCGFDAPRGEKDRWCGGGALCAVANDADPSTGSCHQGCSPEGRHGSITCPAGATCSNAGGYACISNDDICDPAQRDGCTENTKCGFFGWEEETGYCVGYDDELPRRAFGEECDNTSQCASGSVCLSLRSNTPDICTPICRNDRSVTCLNDMICSSLESLSGGDIMGPYGMCVSP